MFFFLQHFELTFMFKLQLCVGHRLKASQAMGLQNENICMWFGPCDRLSVVGIFSGCLP